MKFKFLTLKLFLCVILVANAQETSLKNELRYSLNTKYHIQKDEVFSRVGRQAFMYGLDFGYKRYFGNKFQLDIGFDANMGKISTFTKTNNKATNYLVNFYVSDKYKINLKSEKWQFWLGPKIIFDVNALLPEKELRYGWDISLSLNPSFLLEYLASEKVKLSFETDFSLLGVMWRPNAQGFTLDSEILLETRGLGAVLFEETSFASLHNMFKWNSFLRFEYAFKPKTSLQIIYDLHLTSIQIPRNKTALTNGLKIGILHKF